MSRLRKTVVPFRWGTINANFTNGASDTVNLASFLSNPQNRAITYSALNALPSGVSLSAAGVLSYNGSGAVATASVQFRATSSSFRAESSITPVVVAAAQNQDRPVVWAANTPASFTVTAGTAQTFDLLQYASDPDGDPIVFTRTGSANDGAPGSVVIDSATGVLTVPADAPAGSYTLEIDATGYPLPPVSSGLFEPAIEPEVQAEKYMLWDDAINSPTYTRSMPRLYMRWRNQNVGDFIDANGTPQGTVPFTTVLIPTAEAPYNFDVSTLVQRAVTTGNNKGFYLSPTGTSPVMTFSGRLGTNPPTLTVTTTTGTFQCLVQSFPGWTWPPSSALPTDTRVSVGLRSTRRAIVRFDLSAVTGTVISATMSLYALTRSGTNAGVAVFEADPPAFQVGLTADDVPAPGLASQFPGDSFGADSRVLMAGDWAGTVNTSGTTWVSPKLFPRIDAKNAVSILEDPEAPGTYYWRGEFVPITTGTDSRRGALTCTKTLMFPDRTAAGAAAGYPMDLATYRDDLYYRMYVMLEDDFDTTVEPNKMGIEWDLRFGYWVPNSNSDGGYWQNIGGNGGSPGSGLHAFNPSLTASGVTAQPRHIYYGNLQRMEGGVFIADGPYTDLRPWVGYNYQIDTDLYPDFVLYGDIKPMMFRRGRWYCVEQRLRLNTVSGPFDELGNGTANPDGLIETWINGIKVSSQGNYRWRCHPSMGIEGVGSNWYMGGQAAHPLDEGNMHFRLNHIVCATEYIGPRVKP